MSDTVSKTQIQDLSFLRDFSDIIKNKILFFFPFYGAFLALLFSKSDYVLQASITVQLLCAATFGAGILYAYQVSQTLWALEHVRLISVLRKASPKPEEFDASMTADQKRAIGIIGRQLMPMVSFEDKLFRKTMFLIYFTAIAVLIDIYFGKLISEAVAAVLRHT